MNGVRIPLKNDGSMIIKTLGIQVKEQDDGNILVLSSTDSIDSDLDVIHQGKTDNGEGWDTDRFNKHPVMQWMHSPYIPSLGGGKVYVGKSELGDGLHLIPKFDIGDEFAMQIEGKVRRKVIQETSVGFTSDNYTRRKTEDNDPWTGYDFWDSELQEISWVNRGANPDVDSAIKGMVMRNPDLLKQIEDFDDRFLGMIKDELVERYDELARRIRTVEDFIMAGKSDQMNSLVKDIVGQFNRIVD